MKKVSRVGHHVRLEGAFQWPVQKEYKFADAIVLKCEDFLQRRKHWLEDLKVLVRLQWRRPCMRWCYVTGRPKHRGLHSVRQELLPRGECLLFHACGIVCAGI